MAKIFISYSRKDIDFAKSLAEKLQENGFDYWIDWEGIPPTVDWWKEIEKGIEEADNFLFLISPDSAKSKVCSQEIDAAVKNGKRIIPIVVREIEWEDTPPQLGHLNYIFFSRDDDFNTAANKLIVAIQTDYEWAATHRRLQVKALEWERKNQEKSFLLRGKDLQDAELALTVNSSKEPYPTDLQRRYVERSREFAKKLRVWIVTAVTVAIIAIAYFWVRPYLLREKATPGEWVTIPAGSFTMGMDEKEAEMAAELCLDGALEDDKQYCPDADWLLGWSGEQLNAELSAFDIMKNEVTNAQYQQCIASGDCQPSENWTYEPEDINKPATVLSWVEATEYCKWLGGRLPPEGEWEKAARGPENTYFPWGNSWDELAANLENAGEKNVASIATFAESDLSGYGVSNIAGNVQEWTASESVPLVYGETFADIPPLDSIDDVSRVIVRGGAWDRVRIEGLVSYRSRFTPFYVLPTTGFRCVCDDVGTCDDPWTQLWVLREEYYLDQ